MWCGMYKECIQGGGMIYCEQCRVKQAQKSLSESVLKRLSGREVMAQDYVVFGQLEKSIKQSRKKLFGCEDWVWYLRKT